jgi:BirA family biotin operon repressor/biotin-[acetyl-CoA-carboxylase] ligase
MTTLAAVSVCDTIAECTGLQPRIKWPNDVYIQGRKVCGILIEQGLGVVIGIGLNVNTPPAVFEVAGLDLAGSLALFTQQTHDRVEIARTLLQRLDQVYGGLEKGLDHELLAGWRGYSGLLGQPVTIHSALGRYRGRLTALSFAAIRLEEASGHVRDFTPETVEQIVPGDA